MTDAKRRRTLDASGPYGDPPSDRQRGPGLAYPRDRAQELGRQQGLRHSQYQQRWNREASQAHCAEGPVQLLVAPYRIGALGDDGIRK